MKHVQYDIRMTIFVRTKLDKELPTRREVENKISSLLLDMPRLEDGAEWDVHATSLPVERNGS